MFVFIFFFFKMLPYLPLILNQRPAYVSNSKRECFAKHFVTPIKIFAFRISRCKTRQIENQNWLRFYYCIPKKGKFITKNYFEKDRKWNRHSWICCLSNVAKICLRKKKNNENNFKIGFKDKTATNSSTFSKD